MILNSFSVRNIKHFHFLSGTLSPKKKKQFRPIWFQNIHQSRVKVMGFWKWPHKSLWHDHGGLCHCLAEALKRTGHYSLVLSYPHPFYRAEVTFWTRCANSHSYSPSPPLVSPCSRERPGPDHGSTTLGVEIHILFPIPFLFLVCLWVNILQFKASGWI